MSSNEPNSLWRGCAAFLPQPVNGTDELAALDLLDSVHFFNCRTETTPLPEIVYRSSSGEDDILHHVFRWDRTPYEEAFQNGFEARRQEGTPDQIYFNLDHHVHHGGRPLDSRRPTTHVFVGTTLNSNWHPSIDPETENGTVVYRYEIYAPGGIWVAQTLTHYRYPCQDEVCFVFGIAPQYIRSAQRFRLTTNRRRNTIRQRVDCNIIINTNFNPQSHPPRNLNIRRPIFDYHNESRRVPLNIIYFPARVHERHKREVSTNTTDWYAGDVANFKSYINAAFRSSHENEAYVFMNNEYVLLDYAPGTADDKVVNGPLLICEGYPSLMGTAFAEHGIDSAFGSHNGDEAFIFTGNLCAQINYAPGTTNDKIIKGPMTITAMFPFFKGTVFESGVDAAFEATTRHEAYLFKGKQYALINYNASDSRLIAIRCITQGFASFKNTIFETGIDAAFASHRHNEAYIFKGDSYALIDFAPGTTNDKIIGGVKNILPNWPSLRTILPCKNRGIDVHHHTTPHADQDHDEL